MKGLLLKDLINLKGQAKVMLLLLGFYMVMAFVSREQSYFGGVVTILCALIPVTALSYDERAKWDHVALTMPISRRDMVLSKYILGGIFAVGALVINIIFQMFMHTHAMTDILMTSFLLCGIGILFLSILLPILFKLGVEKGRIIMMMVLFIPTGLVMLLSQSGLPALDPDALAIIEIWTPLAMVMALVVVTVLSIALSLRIYQKKEF